MDRLVPVILLYFHFTNKSAFAKRFRLNTKCLFLDIGTNVFTMSTGRLQNVFSIINT